MTQTVLTAIEADQLRHANEQLALKLSMRDVEVEQLAAKLSMRDVEVDRLQSQFRLLQRKYVRLKENLQTVYFDYLPMNSREFGSLCVQSKDVAMVEYESDVKVDAIDIQGNLGRGIMSEVTRPSSRTIFVVLRWNRVRRRWDC